MADGRYEPDVQWSASYRLLAELPVWVTYLQRIFEFYLKRPKVYFVGSKTRRLWGTESFRNFDIHFACSRVGLVVVASELEVLVK